MECAPLVPNLSSLEEEIALAGRMTYIYLTQVLIYLLCFLGLFTVGIIYQTELVAIVHSN